MTGQRSKIGARLRAGALVAAVALAAACAGTPFGPPRPLHVVRPGESLTFVAQVYDVDPAKMARANGLRMHDTLRVGQKLVLPAGARVVHRVRPGESLADIAARHRVRVSTIVHENGLREGERLAVGRRLVMPRGALPPRPSAARARDATPPAPAEPKALGRAQALLDSAADDYRAARFEAAHENARAAEALLDGQPGAARLRARAAFVDGSALAGLGERQQAIAAFGRVHAHDPGFEPPEGWLSPKLEELYRASRAD